MIAAILFFAILGLVIGSFLNVLADRLPIGEDIFWGRSHCDYCKKPLRWFELIPVVSYLMARGACLRCHKKLSWQYPASELATAAGFVYLYLHSYSGMYYVLFASLVVLFIADVNYQILPDSMIIVGLLVSIVLGPHLVPALGACAFFLFLYLITRGRGMGFGDVKFSFVMGLFLGYPGIVIALYIAFLTGALVGVILIYGKRAGLKSQIAFGPFLIGGTVITFLWGQNILSVLHSWNFLL